MNVFNQWASRFQETANKIRFQYEIRSIVNTPPVKRGSEPFTLLSMVHHRDVGAYLLAVKSFCRFLAPRRFIMIMDPSITEADQSLVSDHIGGIEFHPSVDYREHTLPRGGCWERLIAISDQVQQDYVVQLDADTVTLDNPVEVRIAIASGAAFTLGTEDNQGFTSCKDVACWARQRLISGQHIQVFCEAGLDKIPEYETRKYVRGCAGFAGFPKKSFSRDVLRDFGQTIGPLLGDQWNAWGTEQFTSNYIVSNAQQAMVLPHPKYCHPGRERVGTVFLHFIGYVRYATGRYASVARMTNNMLRIEATQKGIHLNQRS